MNKCSACPSTADGPEHTSTRNSAAGSIILWRVLVENQPEDRAQHSKGLVKVHNYIQLKVCHLENI